MSADGPSKGVEFDLFARARNWKAYWAGKVRPHLGRRVLEVGAGLGADTPYLLGPAQERWLCLEPNAALAARIPATLGDHPRRSVVEVRAGLLGDLDAAERFDTILYIDVLEHIVDDHGELRAALAHLDPGGKIIVLAPAYPWLFSESDRALGHIRRYTRRALIDGTPPGAVLRELFALDVCGLLASAGNRLLLHQSLPGRRQIAFWDRVLVTASRALDPLIGHLLGKSLVAVWRKNP
ncbi:MAG: class I SAM-dependent methyltransferase [Verrucomicrobiota bacterium]